MKKSKKGMTLIELMVGLMVLAVAIIAGSTLFSAAGNGYSRSERLSIASESLSSLFNVGQNAADMPSNVTYSINPVNVTVRVNGKVFNDSDNIITLLYQDNIVRTILFGLDNSYGSGS